MRYLRTLLVIVFTAWAANSAHAQAVYTINSVPNPTGNGYVSNPDGTLSTATVDEINSQLQSLRQATSVEVAVVVINSIGDASPEEFGIGLLRKWGVGKRGQNNGMLILIVTGDRIVRFEVGYGLEGVMTDALSKRIQTTRMMPHLQRNDWDGAALEAVKAVNEYFTDPDSDLRKATEEEGKGISPLWIIVAIIFFIIVSLISGRGGGGGFLGGMILGSILGRRGGGGSGGFGGGFGGFGGGSGGGGGATTRF